MMNTNELKGCLDWKLELTMEHRRQRILDILTWLKKHGLVSNLREIIHLAIEAEQKALLHSTSYDEYVDMLIPARFVRERLQTASSVQSSVASRQSAVTVTSNSREFDKQQEMKERCLSHLRILRGRMRLSLCKESDPEEINIMNNITEAIKLLELHGSADFPTTKFQSLVKAVGKFFRGQKKRDSLSRMECKQQLCSAIGQSMESRHSQRRNPNIQMNPTSSVSSNAIERSSTLLPCPSAGASSTSSANILSAEDILRSLSIDPAVIMKPTSLEESADTLSVEDILKKLISPMPDD